MYKRHLITFILLLLAVVAFTLRFFIEKECQNFCDIIAFVFPTFAAVIEIFLSEKNGKVAEVKIKKLEDNQLSIRREGETLFFDKGIK